MEFIDIHSHYTWQIDDGIATIDDAKEALLAASKQNISKIVVTPHIVPGTTEDIDLIKKRINEFIDLARTYKIEGYCGSEVMLNHDCLTSLRNNQIITINNGPYVLVEFNLARKINDEHLDYLYEFSLKYKVIIAHVERYFYKELDIELIKSWIKRGYIIQVNSSSFLGENGSRIKKNAYKLLENGLIHVIANDTHRKTKHRFPNLKDTYQLLTKKYRDEDIKKLMYDNPLKIIEKKEIKLGKVKKKSWVERRM